MPTGGKTGDTQSGSNGQDRPVVFQKYLKSGGRTYVSQVKIASNGKKYLVLTEGVRDHETQEVKKHIIRIFESDLKDFFSLMQETVLFLRSTKDPGTSVAGVIAAKPGNTTQPASTPPITATARPAAAAPSRQATKPAVVKIPANGNGKPLPPARVAKPGPSAKSTKPAYRPIGRGR